MEGDAGTRQLNPIGDTDADDTSAAVVTAEPSEEHAESIEPALDPALDAAPRRPSRLGRGAMTALCLVLVLLAAGLGVGGYLALKAHDASEQLARNEAAALAAAKDCVSATQAPDTAAMAQSQAKIIECSTGDFGAQANLYSGVLVDAYQAANVQVQVSDLRAAVERHDPDGSIEILVAVRVKVTNSDAADQEQGYRLRVKMSPADGTYKIAQLDQVTS
jgi:Mce-associated membrane protein